MISPPSSKTLYLYRTGAWLVRPSGSSPFQVTRNEEPKVGVNRWLRIGVWILIVGVIVKALNERCSGSEASPPLSTAFMTKVW